MPTTKRRTITAVVITKDMDVRHISVPSNNTAELLRCIAKQIESMEKEYLSDNVISITFVRD